MAEPVAPSAAAVAAELRAAVPELAGRIVARIRAAPEVAGMPESELTARVEALLAGACDALAAGRTESAPAVRRLEVVRLEQREAFITADGSSIRELAGLPTGNAVRQSLAEATVPPGGETVEHFHRTTEEIYTFTAGAGRMRLGEEQAEVRAGDTVVIPSGVRHKLWNDGSQPLVLLCCCAPPYTHEDTVLTESPAGW